MELCILGSGTGVPSPRRGAAGYVVRTEADLLLFDCGPGTMVRLMANHVDFREIDRIFLTHHHPDHCADLVALIFANNWTPGFRRQRPLHITGPRNTATVLQALYEAFPGLRPKSYEPQIEEWEDGRADFGTCSVTSGPVVHGDVPAVGYRISDGTRTLVYSGDTQETPEIISLATGADTLLIESSFPDDVATPGIHLTASAAGRVASRAGVSRAVLTHFYPECDAADVQGQCASVYAGEIVLAQDGMRLLI